MGCTACTEPQCLYSKAIPLLPPMGCTACTESQCLYSRAIPLLPPMGCTACTEPKCLYKGALYLFLYKVRQWKKSQLPKYRRTICANGPRVLTNKHTHKLLIFTCEVRLYVYVEIFAFSFSKSIFVN